MRQITYNEQPEYCVPRNYDNPIEFTHKNVYDPRKNPTKPVWADIHDPSDEWYDSKEQKTVKKTYIKNDENEKKIVQFEINVKNTDEGKPKNELKYSIDTTLIPKKRPLCPFHDPNYGYKTSGLKGRGLLGKWGPNFAADPVLLMTKELSEGDIDALKTKVLFSDEAMGIVNRLKKGEEKQCVLTVLREDTKKNDRSQCALPGGMVDVHRGEFAGATVKREFAEEVLCIFSFLESSSQQANRIYKALESTNLSLISDGQQNTSLGRVSNVEAIIENIKFFYKNMRIERQIDISNVFDNKDNDIQVNENNLNEMKKMEMDFLTEKMTKMNEKDAKEKEEIQSLIKLLNILENKSNLNKEEQKEKDDKELEEALNYMMQHIDNVITTNLYVFPVHADGVFGTVRVIKEKEDDFIKLLTHIQQIFKKESLKFVCSGFVADPRNTDNAWMESCVYSINIDDYKNRRDFLQQLGNIKQEEAKRKDKKCDEGDSLWIPVDIAKMKDALYASHTLFVQLAVAEENEKENIIKRTCPGEVCSSSPKDSLGDLEA